MNKTDPRHPLNRLRHHVSGAIERGEAEAVNAHDALTAEVSELKAERDELVAALHRIAAVEPCEGKAAKNRNAMLQMQAIAHFALVKAGAI